MSVTMTSRPGRVYAPGVRRRSDLKRRGARIQGLPLSEFIPALGQQCEVCSTATPGGSGGFHLDHCHVSGDLRGWLCNACNSGLENMSPAAPLYDKAQAYIQHYRQKDIPT